MPQPNLPTRERLKPADQFDVDLPDIREADTFRQVVKKLSTYVRDDNPCCTRDSGSGSNILNRYFKEVIELPSTFEQLRTTTAGNCLRVLVDHLAQTCNKNEATVNALLCASPILPVRLCDLRLTYSTQGTQVALRL